MPAKKTTDETIVWDSPEADTDLNELFDTWDEAKEEEALAEAAVAVDVPCIIIEKRIVAGRFPDGTIIKAPLAFSVQDLDEVTATHDNEVDQLKALLVAMGNEESAAALEKQNLASVVIFASKFFNLFQKMAQVALGKYIS